MKRILFLSVLTMVLLFAGYLSAADLKGPVEAQRLITGDEPIMGVPANPAPGGLITESPGEIVGWTQYDYQSNGATGNRIVLDTQGGRQVVWMKGIDYDGGQRAVYFNYADAGGSWLVPEEGQVVSQANGAGYTQLSITSDDRAGAAYHETALNYVTYAEDQVSGFGIFDYFDPPDRLSTLDLLWPYITIDRNDRIHIVSCESPPTGVTIHTLGYTMSADGGETWSRLSAVDTTSTLSQNIVSSPVSDKVAIVYSHPIVMDPPVGAQLENNVYYIESQNGETWDWVNGKINVTEYGRTDSLRAYTDVAAIYDYNDELHIAWTAQWIFVIDGGYYVSYKCFLYHYDTGSDAITLVTETDEAWPDAGCDTGGWNFRMAKTSMGVQESTNNIFVVYTGFLDSLDCSAGGFANGDLYMTFSLDDGATWSLPQNLTNSSTPGCQPGDCDSDHWSSLANNVGDDNSLHILYINDKDAGGIPQDEGSVTDNPVMYLLVTPTAVDEGGKIPTTFALSQNYPNPFNAKTNIGFELLEDSDVELTVYDITGAKVTTLVDSKMEAGQHSVNWDAGEVASGVYYYSLKANGEQSSRKMTLLK